MENKKSSLDATGRVVEIIRNGFHEGLSLEKIKQKILAQEPNYSIKESKIENALNRLWKENGNEGPYKPVEEPEKKATRTPKKIGDHGPGLERKGPASKRYLEPIYNRNNVIRSDISPPFTPRASFAKTRASFAKISQPATPDEIDFLYPRMISNPTAGKSYFLAGTGVCKFVDKCLELQFGNRSKILLPSPCKTVLRGLVTDQHMDRILLGFKNVRKKVIQFEVPEQIFHELNKMVHSPDIEKIVSALHVLHRQNGDKGPLVESEDERFKNLAKKAQDFFAQEYATVKNVTHEAALRIVQEKTAPGFVPVRSDDAPRNGGPMAIIG